MMKNIFKTANSKLFLLLLITFLSNLGYGQINYQQAIKADVPGAYFISNPRYNHDTSRTTGAGVSEYQEYDQYGNVYYYAVNWDNPNQNFQGEAGFDYGTQYEETNGYDWFLANRGANPEWDQVSMEALVAGIMKEMSYYEDPFFNQQASKAPSLLGIADFILKSLNNTTGQTKFILGIDQSGVSFVPDNSATLVKGYYDAAGKFIDYKNNADLVNEMLGSLTQSHFDALYNRAYFSELIANNYFLNDVAVERPINFNESQFLAHVRENISVAQGTSIDFSNMIVGGVRGFSNYLSEIGGALTGASSISNELNSYYNAAYAPATDPKSLAITYGIIAAPIVATLAMEAGLTVLATEGTEAAANYAYAQVVNSLSQITLATATRNIALNTLSQWIANGGDVNQINGIEALLSAVPGYVPTILGETFSYNREDYLRDKADNTYGIRTPNNYEVAFLQIGGGLISDKFGNIIEGKAYFRDGVGYTYGEMVKFMVETLSNVLPNSAGN